MPGAGGQVIRLLSQEKGSPSSPVSLPSPTTEKGVTNLSQEMVPVSRILWGHSKLPI